MTDSICLLVEVPICAFRPYASREYQDTYPVPTPASVYGMLLSFLGIQREDKARHRGIEMALAVEQLPERSKVFRKLRRGDQEDVRPDYQDILRDLNLWAWIRHGKDADAIGLVKRLHEAFEQRFIGITRVGGLSLGESSYLVNAISLKNPSKPMHFLIPNEQGFYSLPVWVDHTNASNTITKRFSIDEEPKMVPADLPWFEIPLETVIVQEAKKEQKPKRGKKR